MDATLAPTSLYATRWKTFLAAMFFAGCLVVDLLYYFVWPTPAITNHPEAYQEPTKTIMFIVVLLFLAPLIALGLYWTLTPLPLLELSTASLIYRRFPLPTRTIYWDDVERVSACAMRRDTSPLTHATILTLWFTLKPDRLSAYQGQQRLDLDINLSTLSLHADDLLQMIRNYHDVQMLQTPKKSKQIGKPGDANNGTGDARVASRAACSYAGAARSTRHRTAGVQACRRSGARSLLHTWGIVSGAR